MLDCFVGRPRYLLIVHTYIEEDFPLLYSAVEKVGGTEEKKHDKTLDH